MSTFATLIWYFNNVLLLLMETAPSTLGLVHRTHNKNQLTCQLYSPLVKPVLHDTMVLLYVLFPCSVVTDLLIWFLLFTLQAPSCQFQHVRHTVLMYAFSLCLLHLNCIQVYISKGVYTVNLMMMSVFSVMIH